MLEDQLINDLRNQVLADPLNSSLLTKLGASLFVCPGHSEEALYYLKRAMDINPNNYESYFWAALCTYHNYCDQEQARTLLGKAIELAPEKPECLSFMSVLLASVTPLSDRLDLLSRAIKLAPDWPILRGYLVGTLIQGKEYRLAMIEIEKLSILVQEKKNKETAFFSDPIEEYFETCITGRALSGWEERIKDLLKYLNESKLLNIDK